MASRSEWTARDVPDQTGKRFVVTGGNSGVGLEAAKVLAMRGGEVVLACRNLAKAETAVAEIAAVAPDARVDTVSLDLGSLASVRACAARLEADGRPIDVLVNNAGIMAVPQGRTEDGFESQIGTNHLGHFALTGLVLDLLLASATPRVVTVSSLAHRQGTMRFEDLQSQTGYKRYGTYAQSKLANLLFTMELQRRLRRVGLGHALSVACHPGLALTNLASGVTGGWWGKSVTLLERFGPAFTQSAADGAVPTLRAATDPTAKGGDFFGPARLRQTQGPAVKVKAAVKAYDVHDARGLWEESVRLTGVGYDRLAT